MGELVELIYDAALDPSLWPTFLEALTSSLDMHGFAGLLLHERPGEPPRQYSTLEPDVARAYLEHFHTCDPGRSLQPEPGTAEAIFPRMDPARYENHEFYVDWARPLGVWDGIQGVIDVDKTGASSRLAFLKAKSCGVVTREEIKAFETLLPHLKRAIEIMRRLRRSEVVRYGFEEALNRLRNAVLFLDERGRVVYSNRAGDRLLRDGTGLRIQNGVLTCEVPDAARKLQALVKSVTTGTGAAPDDGSGGVLRIGRGDDRMPLFLLVVPAASSLTAGALVFATDPEVDRVQSATVLERVFGLTPAEAHVALGILHGGAPSEIAFRMDKSVHTVRNQLRKVFAKVGVNSQVDLVRFIGASVPPVRPPGD